MTLSLASGSNIWSMKFSMINHFAWSVQVRIEFSFLFDYLTLLVLILLPEVTQLIKLLPRDEAQSIAASLDLMKKNCVILPINDSSSSSYEFHESGTHWSLLVYNRAEDKYFHLDSLKGSNRKHATIVASKLNLSKASLIDLPCLQQSNSWDCGIFVCCHAELTAQQCLYSGSVLSLPKMAPSIPNSQRRKMQEIIDYLSSKKQWNMLNKRNWLVFN